MSLTARALPMERVLVHCSQRKLFTDRDFKALRKKRNDPEAWRVFAVERLLGYLEATARPFTHLRWNRMPTTTTIHARMESLMLNSVALCWFLRFDPNDVSRPLNLTGTYRTFHPGHQHLRRTAVRTSKFLSAACGFMTDIAFGFHAIHIGYDGEKFRDTQLRQIVELQLLIHLRDMAYEVEYLQADFEDFMNRLEREYWGIRG